MNEAPILAAPESTASRVPTLQQSLFRRVLLIGLAPLLLLAVVLGAGTWEHLERTALQRTAQVAQARALTLEVLLASWRTRAAEAAGLTAKSASAASGAPGLDALVRPGEPFEAAAVVDSDGRISQLSRRAGSPGAATSDLIGLDVSANDWYRDAASGGAIVWTRTYQSLATRRTTAAIVVPLADRRLLLAELSLADLAHRLEHKLPDDALIAVVDERGRLIGHAEQALTESQTDLGGLPLMRMALQQQAATGHFTWREREWIGSAQVIPGSRWLALVAEPRDRVMAPLRDLLSWMGVAVVLAAVAALMQVRRLAASEAARHRQLLEAAHEIEAGSSARPSFGIAEFERLWEALQLLIDRIKRNEADARDARRRMQAVFDAASEVAIVATDLQGRVTTFNVGAGRAFGWPVAAAAPYADMSRWLEPASGAQAGAPEFAPLVQAALDRGRDVRDFAFRRSDGATWRGSVATTLIRNGDDRPAGALMVITDLSDRERAERSLAASRAKSEFLSRISHELRTPMNAVLGFAQLLSLRLAARLNVEERHQLASIQTAGWHLLTLIDDLLDLSRLESGALRLSCSAVPLRPCVRQAMDVLAERARQAGVALKLEIEPAELSAWADAGRLRQVFINLISNAIKYNERGGTCTVELWRAAGGRVGCRVSDTGIGMSDEQLARLFEPFNRLGRETHPAEGHGIGLVIVRELLQAMGTSLAVDSQPGRGARFEFFLPQSSPLAATPNAATPVAELSADDEPVDVLLLEDNEVNVMLVDSMLRLRPRCRLHVADSGLKALEMLRRLRPRLALLDLNLPDGNGIDVLLQTRREPALAGVRIVIFSADASEQCVSQALQAGAVAYLTKPVDVEELLRQVDRWALGAPDAGTAMRIEPAGTT